MVRQTNIYIYIYACGQQATTRNALTCVITTYAAKQKRNFSCFLKFPLASYVFAILISAFAYPVRAVKESAEAFARLLVLSEYQ